MMRQIAVIVLGACLMLQAPLVASQLAGAAAQPQTAVGGVVKTSQAHISGTVVTLNGQPLANTLVRARNLLSGEIGGSTTTAAGGQFAMGVNPGSYMLEVVDTGGQIVGTSAFISAAAVTSITVAATSGVVTAVTGTTGLLATLGATAARSVTYAAAAAGVAGVVTPPAVPVASPSR